MKVKQHSRIAAAVATVALLLGACSTNASDEGKESKASASEILSQVSQKISDGTLSKKNVVLDFDITAEIKNKNSSSLNGGAKGKLTFDASTLNFSFKAEVNGDIAKQLSAYSGGSTTVEAYGEASGEEYVTYLKMGNSPWDKQTRPLSEVRQKLNGSTSTATPPSEKEIEKELDKLKEYLSIKVTETSDDYILGFIPTSAAIQQLVSSIPYTNFKLSSDSTFKASLNIDKKSYLPSKLTGTLNAVTEDKATAADITFNLDVSTPDSVKVTIPNEVRGS